MLIMPKVRYKDIIASLEKKYTKTAEDAPFVGDKAAAFREGDAIIAVSAPHMGFTISVFYVDKGYDDQYGAIMKKRKQAQRSREEANL